MPQSSTRGKTHKKRHGNHQKRTPHFMKVYRPFLPVLILLISVFALFKLTPAHSPSVGKNKSTKDVPAVLSYATNISSSGLLSSTNQRRATAGVVSLSINSKLNSAAQAKANDMATRNYWAHNTPEGNPPWTFITNAGYSYNKAGENLACGFNTSSDVIEGWYNSPAHKENLLHPDYRDVGFGIANADNYDCGTLPAGQQTIIVAMYGTPYSSAAPSTPAQSTPKAPVKAVVKSSSGAAASKVADTAPTPVKHTVTINVTDSSGNPAVGIKAMLNSDPKTGITNDKGVVQFSDIETGSHTLTLEINGAKSETPIELTDAVPEYKLTVVEPVLASNMTKLNETSSQKAVKPMSVNRLDIWADGKTPWILGLLTFVSVAGGAYVFVKHSLAAHRFIVKGERYIHKHKYIDLIVVLSIIGLIFLSRTVASIL